jgi:hypothetical protein
VRRRAKASSVGSISGQASRLGSSLGAFLTPDASRRSGGSGAPTTKPLTFLALAIAAVTLALGAASAAAAAPTIAETTVSAVTTGAALLEADVNPNGEATTFHFEYGLGDCATISCINAPSTDANVGSGSGPVAVAKEITGLAPGTIYHFRVVATNGSGPTAGPDRTFTTYEAQAPTNCPNQAFRTGSASNLADCRAYEMVSPVNKNGGDILTRPGDSSSHTTGYEQSSLDGNKITYTSATPFGDAVSGSYANQYIASRGVDGWSTHGISPPRGTTLTYGQPSTPYDQAQVFQAFTADLTSGWVVDDNLVPLAPDAAQGYVNIYRRDNVDNAFEALTNSQPTFVSPFLEGKALGNVQVQAISADGNHTVLAAAAALTPNANPAINGQLYDSSGGSLHLVSILPDGTAATSDTGAGTDRSLDPRYGYLDHAISDDGSRIFWSAFSVPGDNQNGKLYVRLNPVQAQSALNGSGECTEPAKACTVAISESVTPASSRFWGASADGTTVLFEGSEEDLYEFDVESETPTKVADEFLGVLGTSEDHSYVYFASKEALDAGATAGEANLYVDHNGVKTFIATLSFPEVSQEGYNEDGSNTSYVPIAHQAKVTPDGLHLAFMSEESLTGYDNTDAVSGGSDSEIFIYDAGSQELACVSCNPSGARPIGQRLPAPYVVSRAPLGRPAAAWLNTSQTQLYPARALTDDGNRVFFNSFDALLPGDTNGKQDVYEWERDGFGTCQKAGGCISLISTGQSPEFSEFSDASPDGSDVFFRSFASILSQDPGSLDLYDARVGGGFPIPAEPAPCEGAACQSPPAAPNDPTPASSAYDGPGNVKAAARKKKKTQKKHRKRHHRHAKRNAHSTHRNG